ncbi:MAG: DsbA family protein [Acetobacteraceae bacterium]|nr:DsbA family protein [Acetobacteraceae bacterium]
MHLTRRTALFLAATPLVLPLCGKADDLREVERGVGDPNAKTTVQEFFSLTCTHCAAFARETMPKVHAELIDTGKLRWIYHDFPLDQVALSAAMVARYLPVDRYEPFIDALFASQDRWAFARGVNSTEELWKTAALAGMSRDTFDKAIADTELRTWILQQQAADQKKWEIDATPTFVINGKKSSGEMSFEAFRKLLPET